MSRKCGRKRKIDKVVDDGSTVQCGRNAHTAPGFFFAHIKPQAPCVQNNVHCICHSMGGRYIIISKRMMRMF